MVTANARNHALLGHILTTDYNLSLKVLTLALGTGCKQQSSLTSNHREPENLIQLAYVLNK